MFEVTSVLHDPPMEEIWSFREAPQKMGEGMAVSSKSWRNPPELVRKQATYFHGFKAQVGIDDSDDSHWDLVKKRDEHPQQDILRRKSECQCLTSTHHVTSPGQP